MTILLGSVALNNNLYLSGVTQSKPTSYKQVRTVEGNPILITKTTPGGRVLTLSTTNVSGARQGVWCKSVIDQVKILQESMAEIVLQYYTDYYNVKVVDTSKLTQLFQYEPYSDTKRFVGDVVTIEV